MHTLCKIIISRIANRLSLVTCSRVTGFPRTSSKTSLKIYPEKKDYKVFLFHDKSLIYSQSKSEINTRTHVEKITHILFYFNIFFSSDANKNDEFTKYLIYFILYTYCKITVFRFSNFSIIILYI